jgi:hypothetical protein
MYVNFTNACDILNNTNINDYDACMQLYTALVKVWTIGILVWFFSSQHSNLGNDYINLHNKIFEKSKLTIWAYCDTCNI